MQFFFFFLWSCLFITQPLRNLHRELVSQLTAYFSICHLFVHHTVITESARRTHVSAHGLLFYISFLRSLHSHYGICTSNSFFLSSRPTFLYFVCPLRSFPCLAIYPKFSRPRLKSPSSGDSYTYRDRHAHPTASR